MQFFKGVKRPDLPPRYQRVFHVTTEAIYDAYLIPKQKTGPGNPLAVPIAVLIGIPLYSNAAGMIPITQVLTAKGMAMGTTLAFMMSVIGL